jgi:hypothetical protein
MRYSFFLLTLVATIQGCTPDNRNQIPYVEARGYVDTMIRGPVVSWLSPNKVIYGVNSTGRRNSYSGVNNVDLEASKQVNILDITTQNTLLYRKGQLIKYKNNNIHIRLAMAGYDHQNNRQTSKSKQLYGKLGSETQEQYDQLEDRYRFSSPRILDKCPSDHTKGESYTAFQLNPEHGCLRLPSSYGKDRRWIYFQTNGKAFELMASTDYFFPHIKWISWLDAYVLDGTHMTFPGATKKLKLLFTNGKFDILDVNQAVYHAKPTKVGIIGAVNNKGSSDGLRLFHEGSALQITKGKVRLTEVSPDGCKVAYVTDRKLRVIDVCSIFYGSRTLIQNLIQIESKAH